MKLIDGPMVELLYRQTNLVIPCTNECRAEVITYVKSLGHVDLNKDYEVIIRPKKVKRSLDANAYLWALCDKLAKKLKSTKVEIYREAVRAVGVFDTVLLVDKAVDSFIKKWNLNGDGYVAEISHKSNVEGCTAVRTYYGSHTYDTKEMARLIEYIVEQCKEQDIETKTPNEIEEMKQKWGVG